MIINLNVYQYIYYMYITLDPEQLDTNNIVVSERNINNIMDNAYFYRIFYSDEYMNLNGIFIYFTLSNIKIEKYFNKIKCFFLGDDNNLIIEKIKNIEKEILEKFGNFNLQKKIPTYRIEEQIENKFIKLYSDVTETEKKQNIELILKISGIWEDDNKYGITFRFLLL
uniref:Uncharacterized protein n=1 Tax=viral metagenome TaxID=1070528 RepID=A0A6C0CQV4_9ZZZZ